MTSRRAARATTTTPIYAAGCTPVYVDPDGTVPGVDVPAGASMYRVRGRAVIVPAGATHTAAWAWAMAAATRPAAPPRGVNPRGPGAAFALAVYGPDAFHPANPTTTR